MTRYLHAKAYCLCFEDAASVASKEIEREAAAKKAADDAANDDKKFTQEDLNRFLAEDKRKGQEKQRALAEQLEEMKKQENLTSKQKSDLQTKIEGLQSQYMTDGEKARQESDRQQTEHLAKLKSTEEDRDSWNIPNWQFLVKLLPHQTHMAEFNWNKLRQFSLQKPNWLKN